MAGLLRIPDVFRNLVQGNTEPNMEQHSQDGGRYVQLQLDNQRLVLENQWVSERTKYASTIEELETKIRAIQTAALRERDAAYHYGVEETRKACSEDLAAQAQASREEIGGLQRVVNEKNKELDSVKEMWQDAVRELSCLKTSNKCFAIDDATLLAKWERLQYVIKNFAVSYLGRLTMICPMTANQEAQYESLTPMYKYLLASEDYVDVLLQARIWKFLVRKLFNDPNIVWGEDAQVKMRSLWAMLTDTDNDPKITPKEWHTFRAQTVALVKTRIGADVPTRERLNNCMPTVLQPFSIDDGEDEFTADWHDIIDKATELATLFSQSRCSYAVHFSKAGAKYKFRAECMFDITSTVKDGAQVMLIVSPLLLRNGNSKGEDYDKETILAKASVLCTQSHRTTFSQEDEEEI
ncbi:hypothetical protein GGR57DRAFT_516291 [Xylariaceae sp. FL1272]|nr:hypothetical protein GGR57DRAFT_516291 [Xylariaceae sp. FL1272]